MKYEELMAEFGKTIGFENFTPDEDGICEIVSELGTVTFQYVPEGDVVLMTGLVCELSAEPTSTFLRTFLEANFMYQRTRGSTLSIDPDTNCVMLSRYDRLGDLTVKRLSATLEAFVAALMDWRAWQQAAEGQDAAPVDTESMAGGGFGDNMLV